VAVHSRKPPAVTGDGEHTVTELLATKNAERELNPHMRHRPIELTEHRLRRLTEQGFTPDSVVPDGLEVVLDLKANLSNGADSVDLTDDVHPSYLDVAVQAVNAFPGLGVAGVDMMAHDFSKPAKADNHVVLELNSMPGIGAHHYPCIGKPRDAAKEILDFIIDGPDRSAPVSRSGLFSRVRSAERTR
jgi:D-alanine-D-alanine ligase-like ATP-grasp enzyme